MTTELNKIKKYLDILNKHVDDEINDSSSHGLTHTVHISSSELSGGNSEDFNIRLKPNDEYSQYSQNQLMLLHSFCHLFKDRGAIGMDSNDIRNAHKEIVLRLDNHVYFDSLDEDIKIE